MINDFTDPNKIDPTFNKRLMKRFLDSFEKPSPLMSAAINGNLDSYVARETIKRLEGKETFTIKDIRNARNDIYGVTREPNQT